MLKNSKWILLCMPALLLLLPARHASGQDGKNPEIKIIASPRGTVVMLEGEYGVAGRAPLTIDHGLDGSYRIRAKRWGYENYSAVHRFKAGVSQRVTIRLTRKTRGRAFVRSLVIPGWGQSYTDQKFKSYFIRASALSSLIYLVSRDAKYQNAVDDFDAAVTRLELNQKNSELRDRLLLEVQDAQRIMDDRFDKRRTALIILGGVYIYNLLDSLLFFPDYSIGGLNISLRGDVEGNSLMLGFKAKL